MKKVRVEDAVGMPLCHDITAMRHGFKGALFKRGHVITQEDIPALLDIGKRTVFIWEENAGEIHEEDAAARLREISRTEHVTFTDVSEGKIVMKAAEAGMFRVDRELQNAINSIGDITITSLPDHYPVEAGTRLASMRIVPLVTQEAQIIEAERISAGRKLFSLYPYRPKKAGIVITGSEIYTGRIRDRFEAVARRKLAQYPCEILGMKICDDDLDMILEASEGLLAQGADLLVFSGGMSVDPDDLTPAAVRKMGAEVVSYGVPSQPGNMTLVAYRGGAAVLGVPGAAISMPTTVFDVLLPQVFADVRITKEDLVRLGNGGLCQLCGSCHFPNCTFGRY